MVQWPELCTRGAISLTTSGSAACVPEVEHLHRQHADVAERLGNRGGDIAGACQGDRRQAARGRRSVSQDARSHEC